MFDPLSRYNNSEVATLVLPDGRTVSYLRRRFLPRGDRLPLLAEVRVEPSDRIDLLAHRTLGDPLAYWQVCDANDAMDPRELTERPGEFVRVAQPTGTGS